MPFWRRECILVPSLFSINNAVSPNHGYFVSSCYKVLLYFQGFRVAQCLIFWIDCDFMPFFLTYKTSGNKKMGHFWDYFQQKLWIFGAAGHTSVRTTINRNCSVFSRCVLSLSKSSELNICIWLIFVDDLKHCENKTYAARFFFALFFSAAQHVRGADEHMLDFVQHLFPSPRTGARR